MSNDKVTDKADRSAIASAVCRAFLASGLSTDELAAKSGLIPARVVSILGDTTEDMTVSELAAIAAALGVKPSRFFQPARRAFRNCDAEFTEAHALAALENMPAWAREDESDLAISETENGATQIMWGSIPFARGEHSTVLTRIDTFDLATKKITAEGERAVLLYTDDDSLRYANPDAETLRSAAAVLLDMADFLESERIA